MNYQKIPVIILFALTVQSCGGGGSSSNSGNCRVCGTPDRLPVDIVNMSTMYLSAEFLDVDNDGDLDLALGNWGNTDTATDRLLLNDGAGYFSDAPSGSMPDKLFHGGNSGATGITAIHANADDYIDMLLSPWAANLSGKKVQLLINDGTGRFTDETPLIENNDLGDSHTGWTQIGDFDDDGLMDFASAIYRWRNTGSGFETVAGDGGAGSNGAYADLDGDNVADTVFLGGINQAFEDLSLPLLVGVENSTAYLDADLDGDTDLFMVQISEGLGDAAVPVRLLLNDGAGNFSYANDSIFTPAVPTFFFGEPIVADFNGDGRKDVYIQEGGTDAEPFPGGQNRILINNPDGTFSDETALRLPLRNDFTHHMAIGDLDGDGDIDIFNNSITGGAYVSPSFFINDGAGYFTESW